MGGDVVPGIRIQGSRLGAAAAFSRHTTNRRACFIRTISLVQGPNALCSTTAAVEGSFVITGSVLVKFSAAHHG